MLSAASFAKQCAMPHRHAQRVTFNANGFAPEKPARRTIKVDEVCLWPTCGIRMRSSAQTSTSLALYSSHGFENIMRMKFVLFDGSLCENLGADSETR